MTSDDPLPSPTDAVPELIQVLTDLTRLLREFGDHHWAAWMDKARTLIVASDYYGIEYLSSAYGGMGSFNDVFSVPKERFHEFDRLRRRAAALAYLIRKNAD